jgi:hypothetical protein
MKAKSRKSWAGAVLGLLLVVCTASGRIYRPSHPLPCYRPVVNLPLATFWGIARAESGFDPFAIGRDGFDLGLFQHRSFYNAERGIVNPFDPAESTRAAVKLFTKNLAYLGSIDKAVSAHRRGRGWVLKNGIDQEYLNRVKGD